MPNHRTSNTITEVMKICNRLAWASATIWGSLSCRRLCKEMGPTSWHTRQLLLWQLELLTGRWYSLHARKDNVCGDKFLQNLQFLCLSIGANSGKGHRDTVLRPSSSAGRSAPWEARFIRPCLGSGPLGWGAGWLWRGEARFGACGN